MSFDVKKKIEELNKSDIISGSNARYDIVLEEELKDLNSAGIILRHKKSERGLSLYLMMIIIRYFQ